jgi:GT2 family glycosyltransferase
VAPSDEHRIASLSIVIPTAGAAELDACLESLDGERDAVAEVVVVDNASARPLAYLSERHPRVRIVRNEENLGFVGACNQGAEMSTGELVLFLNDDTVVEAGALRALVDALVDHPAWGACQAKLLVMHEPTRLDTAGSFMTATGFLVHRGAHEPETNYVRSDEVFAAKGAALVVRRRVLDEVGVFDPDFFAYFEDSDLCWRLWVAGWEVGFAADARVRHRLGTTASTVGAGVVQFHSFKNRICSVLKNCGGRRLVWMLPVHLGLCFGVAVWFRVRGRPELSTAVLRAIAWNGRNARRTLRKRVLVQRNRRVSDAQLWPRISRPTSLRSLVGYARTTAGSASEPRVG